MSRKKSRNQMITTDDLLFGMGGKGGKGSYRRCYEDHPTIEFENEGDVPAGILAGGNCSAPIHKDADVYIALDSYWTPRYRKAYPWEPEIESSVIEFGFRIADGHAPADTENAKKMIAWVCDRLREGKKVHIGCIGGHGRTGMILSAIVNQMCDMVDSTTWVRENYCKKAVESKEQVNWLHSNFGIKKVKGSKEGLIPSSHGGTYPTYDPSKNYGTGKSFTGGGYAGYAGSTSSNYGGVSERVTSVGSRRNIWKKSA